MAERQQLSIQENLRVRTSKGPIGLREPRERPGTFKFPDSQEQQTIRKDWLRGKAESTYHTCIKQSMLIAARRIDVFDASDKHGHTVNKEKEDQSRQRLGALIAGRERIPVDHLRRTELKTVKKREDREKDSLVKFGQSCMHGKKVRQFVLDEGKMVVYLDNALKASYKLDTAQVAVEERSATARPRFEPGAEKRIRVVFDERKAQNKEDVFLYPSKGKNAREQDQQIKRWKRAFQMSKLVKSEVDRKALRMCLGRATSGALVKGWEALFIYAREIKQVRDLARQMASRLIKSDFSRGWTKMKVLHQKWKDDQDRRKQQQVWAARFMCEKLAKMGGQKVKAADEIRDSVVTKIQQSFRKYREVSIMDREYALDSSQLPPTKKGRQGQLMDISLEAVTCDEALHLSLGDTVLEHYKANRSSFETQKSTYSAAPTPAGRPVSAFVFLSDNMSSLSFTLDAVKPQKGQEHLTKADWANFVNLDRISSVVLHAGPISGSNQTGNSKKWITINGPRVSFGKRVKQSPMTIVGSKDPLSMLKSLTAGKRVRWVTMRLQITGSSIGASSGNSNSNDPDDDPTVATFAVIHVLGYSFKTKAIKSNEVDANKKFEASIPLPPAADGEDDTTFACLDNLRISAEIYETSLEERGEPSNIYEKRSDLNETVECATVRYVGSTSLIQAFGSSTFQSVLPAGDSREVKIPLGAPAKVVDRIDAKTPYLSLAVDVQCEEKSWIEKNRSCVSPELMGAGQNTALFTSHRGAWFDPRMGLSKFNVAHVGSFVELALNGLRFPSQDKIARDDRGTYKYRVRAKVDGFYTHSSYLHRAKDGWEAVLGPSAVDKSIIKFQGTRLYLPLPPGCWGEMPKGKGNATNNTNSNQTNEQSKEPPEPPVTVEIWRMKVDDAKDVNFTDFKGGRTAGGAKRIAEKMVYKAVLRFEKLPVDTVQSVSAFLTDVQPERDPEAATAAEISVNQNTVSANEDKVSEGLLNIDFALRDWDYVKAVSMIGEETGAHEQTALCVGEKAMLNCEEPMISPPGSDPKRFIKKPWKGTECPLREPCLSSEYADSGLDEVTPPHPFNQSIIPNYCVDIIPHKYVMPLSEQQFRARRLPGVYWRVMDSLAARDRSAQGRPTAAGTVAAKNRIVDKLSHVVKHVPVTLLAVYPDETCDVEVDKDFMQNWKNSPERRYAVPGVLRNGPMTDVFGEERWILKEVPLLAVTPVHSAGFNVYDSSCRTTEDCLNIPAQKKTYRPSKGRKAKDNTLNRNNKNMELKDNERVPPFEFYVSAGPLPADSSDAACLYEWRLHVQAGSEYEMHQFVAMLRQAARVSHFQQAVKMVEYYKKGTEETPSLAMTTHKPRSVGMLEVVLVEARRLKPKRDLHEDLTKKLQDAMWHETLDLDALSGTTSGEPSRSTPVGNNITTFIETRLIDGAAKKVIPVKGNNADRSRNITGTDSPAWCIQEVRDDKGNLLYKAVDELGGYVYKVSLNPEKYSDLTLDFAAKISGATGQSDMLGHIGITVQSQDTGMQLTNPDQPFRNMWCPLYKDTPGDGPRLANITGEIHIMTRWMPPEKLNNAMGQQTPPVRETFLKEIMPRILAQRAREPTTGIEAQYIVYNANLVRSRDPETPAYQKQRNIEMMINAARHQMCLDQRQREHWETFEEMCARENLRGLSQIRLQSFQDSKGEQNGQGPASKRLLKLQELIEHGIPSMRRQRIWLELTLTTFVQENEPLGPGRQAGGVVDRMAQSEYEALVKQGAPQNSDAMLQLQEDCFHMASWETSSPVPPEFMNLHMARVKKASDVCTALIAVPANSEGSIVYCESLLVIAYFLMLPQNADDRVPFYEKEAGMSESSVFWLLYTLIRAKPNKAFKEYFGTDESKYSSGGELCVTSGAMEDIHLLDMCLAYHKVSLWNFLNAIGFQLATVFYGAFMRLFATYMPTLTVFRFWDLLFSHTADPKSKNPRDPLISLAFGIMMVKEKDIMACKSAVEVRDVILGALGALHDSSTVIDIVVVATGALWGQSNTINPMKASGLQASKVFDWAEKRKSLFNKANEKTKDQNRTLKLLMQTAKLGALPERKEGPEQNATPGVSTKKLMRSVLPTLQTAVDRQYQQVEKIHWAMHRPMPLALRHLEEDSLLAPVKNFYKVMVGKQEDIRVPYMVEPQVLTKQERQKFPVEPMIEQAKFLTIIKQQIPAWDVESGQLWRAFCNWHEGEFPGAGRPLEPNQPQEEAVPEGFLGKMRQVFNPVDREEDRGKPWHEKVMNNAVRMANTPQQAQQRPKDPQCLSLHDLFTAFILSSRGTVAEKASALFNIYGYMERKQQNTEVYHAQEITRLAKSMATAQFSDDGLQRTPHPEPQTVGGQLPPEATKNALRFVVMSDHPREKTLIGEVFIPSLDPFLVYSQDMAEQAMPRNFMVWGKPLHRQQTDRDREKTVVMAEIQMAIAWTPKAVSSLHQGQLFLQINYIQFVEDYCSDYYRQNPYVEVFTQFHERRKPDEQIERWDLSHARATDGNQTLLGRLAGGEKYLKFPPSMVKNMAGKLTPPARNGKGMGYDENSRKWMWNEHYGKMFSKPEVELDKDLFTGPVNRKTTMDLQGVRILVSAVLRRSLLNFSNRQQLLIADSFFHRQRVVPGILEACLASGSTFPKGKDKTDVTNLIVLEHEKQLANNGGYMNLFQKAYMEKLPEQKISLDDMGISKGRNSTLFIKYVRGGDGERCIKAIDISSGAVQAAESEVELELLDDWPHTKVTKEEFVACVLNNPLLSEPIRRLGEQTDKQTQPTEAIMLDITIAAGKDEEAQTLALFDAQQTILLEVWDKDKGRADDDFLGEAWMPPLSELTREMKDFVRPLQKADFSADAESPSRPSPSGNAVWKKPQNITGQIHFSAAWIFPMEAEEGTDLRDRAKAEEARNTGVLRLTINSCKNLRAADASMFKRGKSDPHVQVWVRNDANKKWRKKPLFKTKKIDSTLNPDFKQEGGEFKILQGAYEERNPPEGQGFFYDIAQTFKSAKTLELESNRRDINAVRNFSDGEVKLKFGPGTEGTELGTNHGIQVFMGDSIRSFKDKVTEACKIESRELERDGRHQDSADYDDIVIGHKDLVMAFVPSPQVTRLFAQGLHQTQEYKEAYHQAVNDPSSWQPLDPAMTFNQYAATFGFGRAQAPQLRIVEGTELYKRQNLRFKKFAEEEKRATYRDTNTKKECFGYVKVAHDISTDDAPEVEWRPAMIQAEGTSGSSKTYSAKWLLPRYQPNKSGKELSKNGIPQSDVVLAPRAPLIDEKAEDQKTEKP